MQFWIPGNLVVSSTSKILVPHVAVESSFGKKQMFFSVNDIFRVSHIIPNYQIESPTVTPRPGDNTFLLMALLRVRLSLDGEALPSTVFPILLIALQY